MISFFRGHPTDTLLPSKEVAKATQNVLLNAQPCYDEEDSRHPLQYGPDEGSLQVRKSFAKFSNRTLGGTATADCINLTNGASYGAASALLQLCDPITTKRAFLVSPTYFLINKVFENAGFAGKLSAVVETDQLDLDGLEASLKQLYTEQPVSPGPKKFQFVIYLIPTYSNPGGYTVSLEQRQRLLGLARKYDMLILCDEVYEWLNYNNKQHPPLFVTLDRETLPAGSVGNVVANFSMSKVLGPGLRVGWQETATAALAHQLSQSGAIISGGTPAHLSTYIVADLFDTGAVDGVLDTLNKEYKRRSVAYVDALKRVSPDGTTIEGDGGYFFWLTLPTGYDVAKITTQCREQGIIVAPGDNFEVSGDEKGWGKRCFRFSLSCFDENDAVPAIEKWGEIVHSFGPK